MAHRRKLGLTAWILIGLGLGIVVGLLQLVILPDSRFTEEDFTNPGALLQQLQNTENPLSAYILSGMPEESRTFIRDYSDTLDIPQIVLHDLTSRFNTLLSIEGLYTPERFSSVELTPFTSFILQNNPGGGYLESLNRYLLQDAFSEVLAPAHTSGQQFIIRANIASIAYVYQPLGRVFLNGIRLLVVPLVLVSLMLGTAAIGDLRKLGRIGGKTMLIYLSTTAIAISIGYLLATLVQPGAGLSIPVEASFEARQSPSVVDIFVDIVPTNPIAAMVEGKMLQVIFVAILAGLAIAALREKADPLKQVLEAADLVIQKMVWFIMLFAPIGVFALIAKVVAGQGIAVFIPLLKYMMCIFGALGIHALVTYPAFLMAFARLSPFHFFRNVHPAMVVAFSTSSSNATLPVTLQVAEERIGADESVSSFTIPLGATINMDGTAIMQGVATVFIAGVYGIALTPGDFAQVVLMATLASIGTAGVPGVGLIMLSMVLTEIGLPLEGIAIILGVDRILDMTRTMVNIVGDLMTTTVVAKSEGALDMDRFLAKNVEKE